MNEPLHWAINLDAKPEILEIARVLSHPGHQEYLVPEQWLLHLYEYDAHMHIEGIPLKIYPGCITLMPPDTRFQFAMQTAGLHYYVRFQLSPPRPENPIVLPAQIDVRGDLYRFEQKIIESGRSFIYRDNRLHAEVKFWDLLLELANCGGKPVAKRHPSLEKALELIEARLSQEISVSGLARDVGISRNHLTRLFQWEKDTTVVRYIRQQRAQRAKHLLETTSMSISEIALQIHSPNLQSFSALIKQETGHPPTFYRNLR